MIKNNLNKNILKNDQMTIEIEAFDTLFFRDGKPFSRGEETWADGIFPPSPSVIYGALRSCYFSQHLEKLKCANDEKNDPTKDLKITGIYLKPLSEDFFCIPLPLDCVNIANEDKTKVFIMHPEAKSENVICSSELAMLNKQDFHVESASDGLIQDTDFKRYLEGTVEEFYINRLKEFIIREPKVGIGRTDQTHTTKESMLYRVGMQRMMASLIISFERLILPEYGMMKLGGEGKAVHYHKIHNPLISPMISIYNRFKLVLTTPAIFEHGWLPQWIDPETLTGELEGIKLKLIAAVIGKPLYIGGFDLKAQKPKPMRKAVPAGSVYYFEIVDGNSKNLLNIFSSKAISDYYSKEGYGIAYFGGMKK